VATNSFILVFESDDLLRALLERWLRAAGYAVHAAAGVEGGHGALPDLVIADLPAPRRSASLLRALRTAYAAPLLLTSGRFGRGPGAAASAAAQLAVRGVLAKPYTEAELLAAVQRALA
jgi:DNA-binding response OmpR family regulator